MGSHWSGGLGLAEIADDSDRVAQKLLWTLVELMTLLAAALAPDPTQ